ncbi:hypothetical protein CASFOL_034133 [Castilleja foliolosa]|uniref:Uncharacterized protein n=1 Tax=Castilleja foliolosa TaxID=1961234 RepID=A0ABD3BXE3_9LAMI
MSSCGGNSHRGDKGKAIARDDALVAPPSPMLSIGDDDFSIGGDLSRDEILEEYQTEETFPDEVPVPSSTIKALVFLLKADEPYHNPDL